MKFRYSVYMRGLPAAVLLLTFVGFRLTGDTREVTKTTIDGHENVVAQYIQGGNLRTEDLSEHASRRPVTVQNFERRVVYALDLQSRKYVEVRPFGPDWILSLAQLITRPPRTRESGKTVNIYYETLDTGESKQLLGHTAKHLLLRERHIAEPGACTSSYQSEKDGWYIPRAELDRTKGSYRLVSYIGRVGIDGCHDMVVKHGNPFPNELPVIETEGPVTREILALSNDPLDKSLFEVPSGFQKVDALPGYPRMSWFQQLELDWAQLENAFESWFE